MSETANQEDTMTTDLYAQAARYGVAFEGTLVGPEYHDQVDYSEALTLAEVAARHGKVSRIRMIGGDYIPGRGKCYDISYVHATIDGQVVPVQVTAPSWSLIPRRGIKAAMIAWAKAEGVYAKGLDMLDDGVYSILG